MPELCRATFCHATRSRTSRGRCSSGHPLHSPPSTSWPPAWPPSWPPSSWCGDESIESWTTSCCTRCCRWWSSNRRHPPPHRKSRQQHPLQPRPCHHGQPSAAARAGGAAPAFRRGEGGHASGRERRQKVEGTGNKICARSGGNNEGSVSGEQERSEGEGVRERAQALGKAKMM